MSPTTTPLIAQRHEALYLRLAALLAQVQAFAARRPEASVPEGVRILAEGVLFDARPFTHAKKRGALPVAAPEYAGLAAQLGQAQAALDAFEARHSAWHPELGGFCWCVAGPVPLPVKRLRAALAKPTHPDLVATAAILRRRLRAAADRTDSEAARRHRAEQELREQRAEEWKLIPWG